MIEVTLEAGRTYGVLFEVPVGATETVKISGVEAQTASISRPGTAEMTLEIGGGGVMNIPAGLTAQESYAQVSAGGAIFGFRVFTRAKRTVTAEEIGAYAADGIRKTAFSIPEEEWEGDGPYTAMVQNSTVTPDTWADIRLDSASRGYGAEIAWAAEEGGIRLSVAEKPAGTLTGWMRLMEVREG